VISFVVALVIGLWSRNVNLMDRQLSILCHINAGIWLIVLWWAFHHLFFQIAALFKSGVNDEHGEQPVVRFAVFYLTCDDFVPRALQTCFNQQYPPECFRVLICDDSEDPIDRGQIDRTGGSPTVVRRLKRKGFKAGNVNHALLSSTELTDEWIVFADADQMLPEAFLAELSAFI
jgi:cellulose synthase/poly-beta-1,6-N-acetylglucosamine synthase-like glycosyltransferase